MTSKRCFSIGIGLMSLVIFGSSLLPSEIYSVFIVLGVFIAAIIFLFYSEVLATNERIGKREKLYTESEVRKMLKGADSPYKADNLIFMMQEYVP